MKKLLFITVFILFLFSGCKKEGDHLTGDMEALVGTWSWYHTYGSGGTDIPGYHDRTPASTGDSYRIKFEKEGRFKTWKNGDVLNKGTVEHFNTRGFNMLDGNYEQYSSFHKFDDDTISLSSWPTDEGSNIRNYFVRVN